MLGSTALTSGHQVSAAGGVGGAQSLWWSDTETPAEPLPKDLGHGKPLKKTHSPARPAHIFAMNPVLSVNLRPLHTVNPF